MPRRHSRRAIALTALAASTGLALAAAPAVSAAPSGTVTIDSTVPTWLSHGSRNAISPLTAAPQSVRVYLAPKGGLAALKTAVAAVSTPGSAQYGKYLTTSQFQATYSPTQAAADAVSSYLSSKGLTVAGVAAGRRYVEASGTASQLNSAFGVSLASWTHDGQTVTANSTPVALPAAVGASVLTVSGLDTTDFTKSHTAVTPDVTPPPAFVNGRPCGLAYGSPLAAYQADYTTPLPKFEGTTLPYAPCGYTGAQFRAAYEAGSKLTGKGVTVAITDAYDWQLIQRDASTYAADHGDAAYADNQLVRVQPRKAYNRGGKCGPSGWSGEETLDVEAVHAMAPAAKIRYYASASCFDDDFVDTLGRVVDDNIAKLVSNSWSDVELNESAANVQAYEQVFLQGSMQGQTFLFSSGDDGDEVAATGVKQVGYPGADPYVTAAGGTATGIDAAGRLAMQTGWGTEKYNLAADGKSWTPVGYLYGAGGGYSTLFPRPTYQSTKVVSTTPGRAVPDVSMDADPSTGMLVGQTQTFPDGVHYGEYRIGGTSLASPLLAGFFALAVQAAKSGFGAMNPLLYKARSSTITDVLPVADKGVVRADNANGIDASDGTVYTVRTFGQNSSLTTATGWDTTTGLGVPNPRFLAAVAATGSAGAADTGAPQQ